MTLTARHRLVALAIAVVFHLGLAALVLGDRPDEGSQDPGSQAPGSQESGVGGITVALAGGGLPGEAVDTLETVGEAAAVSPPSDPTSATESLPGRASEPIEPVEPTETVEPVEAAEPIAAAQSLEAAEPIEAVENAEPVAATESVASAPEPKTVVPQPAPEAVDIRSAAETQTIAGSPAVLVPRHRPTAPPDVAEPAPPRAARGAASGRPTPTARPETPVETRNAKPEGEPTPLDGGPTAAAQQAARPVQPGNGGRVGAADAPSRDADRAGGGAPGAAADYLLTLRLWLEKHKEYPRRAKLRRQQGTAVLSFVIAPDGRVLRREIDRSSGHVLLDRAVMAMIERAQPLPSPPADIGRDRLAIRVPVSFVLAHD